MGEILLERASDVPGVVDSFPNIMGPNTPELNTLQGEFDVVDVDDIAPQFLSTPYAHGLLKSFSVFDYVSENRYLLSNLVGM
ncbi:hypothetical protein J3E71DRAFT_347699 [Bipolaris maydis]|nr:hypothetical protein J3E73DRAFT_375620 [Bipolaris maydis]KAJ6276723.1 hypothetical protein J3E71DRAFT_347699 [Bipolaris maydis]